MIHLFFYSVVFFHSLSPTVIGWILSFLFLLRFIYRSHKQITKAVPSDLWFQRWHFRIQDFFASDQQKIPSGSKADLGNRKSLACSKLSVLPLLPEQDGYLLASNRHKQVVNHSSQVHSVLDEPWVEKRRVTEDGTEEAQPLNHFVKGWEKSIIIYLHFFFLQKSFASARNNIFAYPSTTKRALIFLDLDIKGPNRRTI